MLKNIFNSLKLQPEQNSQKHLYLYILIAYLFGVFIRLILLYQIKNVPSYWVGGKLLPVWTSDAGLYGFYAKQILSGVSYPLTSAYMPSHFIAGITTLFQTNIDWVMVFLPIFVAPLLAIPMILIGKALNLTQFGFLSALVALSAINFYSQSHLGYMDTGILNLFFIFIIIYFMIETLKSDNLIYAFGGSLSILLFTLWYQETASLTLALLGMTFMLTLLFYRQKSTNYQAIFLFAIAVVPYDPLILIYALVITLLLFTMLNKYHLFSYHYYLLLLLVSIILILLFFDLSHYYQRAMQYVNQDTLSTFTGNGITYYYTDYLPYVSEVRKAYLWESQPGMYGTYIYVLFATVGYILLSIAYPQTLFFLPFFLLGALTPIIGIRFAIYASPVLAFGSIYMLYILQKMIVSKYSKLNLQDTVYPVSSLILIFMLNNILLYNITLKKGIYPHFKSEESKLLKKFSKQLSKNDKIIAGWELGYSLWYYTGYRNTLTDNGAHGGPDTHAIAKIFMSSNQQFSANASKYLSAKLFESQEHHSKFILPYLTRSQDLNVLFSTLENRLPSTQNNGDTYIVLHRNMLNYFSLMSEFASKDLKSGTEKGKNSVVFSPFKLIKGPFSRNAAQTIGYPYVFDHEKGEFILPFDDVQQKINKVITTEGHRKKEEYTFHGDSSYYLIAEEDKYLFYLNDTAMQSFLVQTLILDNYDHTLFKKVGETHKIKIYKVK